MIVRTAFQEPGGSGTFPSPEITRVSQEKGEPRDFSETEIDTMLRGLQTVAYTWTPWCVRIAQNDLAWNEGELLPEYKTQLDEFLRQVSGTALLDIKVYKQLQAGKKTHGHIYHDLSGEATILFPYLDFCKEGNNVRNSLSIVAKKLPIYSFILEDILLRSIDDEMVSPVYERSVVPPEIFDTSIDNAMHGLSVRFPEKEIDITGSVARLLEAHEEIRTVPGVFMNALTNCVGNAAKDEIGATHIQVQLLRSDTALLIYIIDDGKGMEADQLNPLVPERFIFNKVSETNSTGLGLHFVDTRIQSLGGSIHVASRPRGKSDFSVFTQETGVIEGIDSVVVKEHFQYLPRVTQFTNTVFELAIPISEKQH